jgi:hypothetical protein
MKKIFSLVIAAPILALFVGIGVLAFRIGDHWDERNTDVLISNVTMICGIGGLAISLALAAFVGLVFYARWQRDKSWDEPPGWRHGPSRRLPSPGPHQPPWMDMPPQLPDMQEPKGRLYTSGPGAYEDLDRSLFDDNGVIDTQWRDIP